MFSEAVGDVGGISHFSCFYRGQNPSHFRQLRTYSLSWALRGLQMHHTNGAPKVPLLFHPMQRELRYGPASTTSRVHISTDQKGETAGFLEDPTQVETVVVLCGARNWTQRSWGSLPAWDIYDFTYFFALPISDIICTQLNARSGEKKKLNRLVLLSYSCGSSLLRPKGSHSHVSMSHQLRSMVETPITL